MVAQLPTANAIVSSMAQMRGEYELRSQYAASEETKWLPRPVDLPTQGVGADYHYRDENRFYYMLEMARNVENDDPAVSQGIDRFIDNVVQGGYVYAPDTGVDALDRLLEERWESYTDPDNAATTDYHAEHNWHSFERLSARRIVVDGDMGINPMSSGQLQALEAHRIRSPIKNVAGQLRRRRYVVHGIEKNRRDQTVRYWVVPHETDGFSSSYGNTYFVRDTTGVMAWDLDPLTGQNERNFFHLYNPKRFSQSRGVTAFHAVLNTAGMHADLQFATLVRAQLASYVGFTREIPLWAKDEYEGPQTELVYCPQTGQMERKGFDLSPGSTYDPEFAGEKIMPFTANIPNPEFFDHSKMLLTFIATTLGMPLCLFLIDASDTNFSSWKAAVDKFKVHAQTFQRMHSSVLHRPVLRFQQRRWLRQDRGMRDMFDVIGPAFFRHTWRFPKWDYVQPKDEVAAEVAELGNLLDSPRGVAARHNRSFAKVIRETCEDRAAAIECGLEKAQELNQHPYIVENPHESVTWREVMPLPLSDSAQMQLLTGDPAAEESSDEPEAQGLDTQATS